MSDNGKRGIQMHKDMEAYLKAKAPKFTPGPWTTEERDDSRILIWADGFHDSIAELDMGFSNADEEVEPEVEEEQRANARLIAAAPALYEICCRAMMIGHERGFSALEKDARAVLEKVKG